MITVTSIQDNMAKGTRYSDDFKKQIVRLYESGKKVSVISSEYEISSPPVYKWINESKTTGSFKTNDNLTDEQRELKSSRKRIAELEMENEILKKASRADNGTRIQIISRNKHKYSITLMCKVLEVARIKLLIMK